MESSTIRRLAQQLRNISQLSYQVGTNERDDLKVSEVWPDRLREFATSLIAIGQELQRQAGEQEAYHLRRVENADALVVLAHSAANMATVVGKDGDSLKILTHSDPAYILSVLTDSQPKAREVAISRLTAEQRNDLIKLLQSEE